MVRRDEALFGEILTLVERDSENGTVLSVYRLAKTGADTRLIYFSLAPTARWENSLHHPTATTNSDH